MSSELKIEHHAVLNTDDLEKLSALFNKGIQSMIVDLRGRTTIAKSKSKTSELGIKKLSHTYIEVIRNDFEFSTIEELKKVIKSYDVEGVNNLYVVRLQVVWDNGDMQEWHRAVIQNNDMSSDRGFPSGRFNTLVMKMDGANTYQKVEKLQEKYGDMVLPTMCANVPIEGKPKKRTCMAILKAIKD